MPLSLCSRRATQFKQRVSAHSLSQESQVISQDESFFTEIASLFFSTTIVIKLTHAFLNCNSLLRYHITLHYTANPYVFKPRDLMGFFSKCVTIILQKCKKCGGQFKKKKKKSTSTNISKSNKLVNYREIRVSPFSLYNKENGKENNHKAIMVKNELVNSSLPTKRLTLKSTHFNSPCLLGSVQ